MQQSEKQIANGLYDPITVRIFNKHNEELSTNYITPNKFSRIMIGKSDTMIIESYDSYKKVQRKEIVICSYIDNSEIVIGIGEWKHGNIVTYYDFEADLYIGVSYVIPNYIIYSFYIINYLIYMLIVVVAIILGIIIAYKFII